MPVALLGLSASLTGVFSFVTLLFLLDRKIGGFDKNKLFIPIMKIATAAALMGAVLYIPLHIKFGGVYFIDYIIDTTRVLNLLILTSAALLFGLAIYIWITWQLKSEELRTFGRLIPDFRKLQKLLVVDEKIDSGTPDQ